MTEYNLNEIENIVNTKFFTPIVLSDEQQIEFRTVDNVRSFAKGNGDLPAHVMMARMMEAFFGHYSTCLISDTKGLVTMFGKLFSGWSNKLYKKNQVLDPNEEENFFEPAINQRRMQMDQMFKHGNDDIKSMVKSQRIAFNADHRTKSEIDQLLSKYCFKIASRFYVVPVAKPRDLIKKYMELRLAMIEEWYDVVDHLSIKTIWPDDWFTSLDPKTVAIKVFPQDVWMDKEDLDQRFEKFKKWHKKAGNEALAEAKKNKDPVHIQHVIHEWDTALLYAKSLHDGMKVFEDDNLSDFIVDSDEEDEEKIAIQNKAFDDMEIDNYVQKRAINYDSRADYGDDMTDEQIEELLRKQDKKAKRIEKQYGHFFEKTEEGSDDE